MRKQVNYRVWVISIHLLFWLLLSVMIAFVMYGILRNVNIAIGATLINVAGFLMLVYGHLLYLLPVFFDKKRYIWYGIGIILLLIFTATFRFYVGWSWTLEAAEEVSKVFTPTYFGAIFFSGIFFLLISIPLRLINNWFKKRELETELNTYQLEAELRFLKAQVNPHFLFNALNNIYSLSFTESKKAPEMILKLSDMMSYMLYDCKSETVPLQSEVNYLHNYIALQQLKKDGELNIEFNTSGPLDAVFITPMLFIPFFENAFKHGNLEDIEKGWMKSELKLEGEDLYFKIENSQNELIEKKEKGGVGLENIEQRLKLLFPDKHQLEIKNNGLTYQVRLHLNLSKS